MIKKIINALRLKAGQISTTNKEVMGLKFALYRKAMEEKILYSTESGVTDQRYCNHDIIISLTTYGRRIYDVCFTIESLMQQTVKANNIVLWLDKDAAKRPMPESLKRQEKRGLTILPTKDIRSYTKLIPAIKKFPDAAIITVDDDILYDFDIIERLISAYLQDFHSIHACRLHSMTFRQDGQLKPYEEWDWCKESSSPRHFITGVGGALYPPKSLASEVLNEEIFSSICPTADDVWFTAMAKLKGTQIKKVVTRSLSGEDYVDNVGVQDMGLCNINVGAQGQNNKQIQAVFSKYNIYDLIS